MNSKKLAGSRTLWSQKKERFLKCFTSNYAAFVSCWIPCVSACSWHCLLRETFAGLAALQSTNWPQLQSSNSEKKCVLHKVPQMFFRMWRSFLTCYCFYLISLSLILNEMPLLQRYRTGRDIELEFHMAVSGSHPNQAVVNYACAFLSEDIY